MSARPQILLVPSWSEVQWAIKPQLEEWADVASYDPPGVGTEPPVEGRLPEAIVARGAAEIERRGWTGCIVAGDDFGSVFATLIAAAQRSSCGRAGTRPRLPRPPAGRPAADDEPPRSPT